MKKLFPMFLLFAAVVIAAADDYSAVEDAIIKWDDNAGIYAQIEILTNKETKSDTDLFYLTKLYYYYGIEKQKDRDKLAAFEEGRKYADLLLANDPVHTEGMYYLAAILGKIGLVKGVLKSLALAKPIRELCEKIISIDPNHPGAHHILGVLLRKLPGFAGGDNKRSREYLAKACELRPTYSLHFYEFAETLIKVKEKEKAREVLEHLINGDFPKDRIQEARDKKDGEKLLSELK